MINKKRVLAVVTARKGSKGLQNKNIIDFLGKPLMAWSIETGIQSKYVDRTILSTDSVEISALGKRFGADVPFLRPADISQDLSSSYEVLLHALDFMSSTKGEDFDLVTLLEPTSPLRTAIDLDHALEELDKHPRAKSLVSVGRVENQHPEFQFELSPEGFLSRDSEEFNPLRRQEVSKRYFLDGSVYISYIETFVENKSFVGKNTLGFILPKWKTVEIDDEYDYEMALSLGKKYLC